MNANASLSAATIPAEMAVREIVDCPLCGSAGYSAVTSPQTSDYGATLEPLFREMQFQVVECDTCRTVYQRNRPNPESLRQFYETGDYHCYESLLDRGPIIRYAALFSARRVVQEIDKYRPHCTDTIVDFGCGSGSWIELFKHVGSGWNIIGTEIFPALCTVVEKNTGAKCVVADHETIDQAFAPKSVDAIYLHHVIEHVPNPADFLQKAKAVLVDGGIIYGQTPNRRSWESRIFGDDWVQWHLPHHLVVFDFETMAAHARKAGFEVVKLSSSLSGATQWAASLLKWVAKRRGRHYRTTKEPLHAPLTLLFTPLTMLQAAVSQTSHMDFILRKLP